MLIVDSCQSAASVGEAFKPGPMGDRSFGQLAYDKGMRLLVASRAAEYALEHPAVKHGLLTYALVREGLEDGAADFDPADGRVTLGEWLRWGEHRVPGLARDVVDGKIRAFGWKGLHIPKAPRRIAQQPKLWDLSRGRAGPVLHGTR